MVFIIIFFSFFWGVQISIAVGILRVPILHHFPFLLIFSTIATLGLSFLITKSGPLRYFFGLPAGESSFIPGKTLKGLLPAIILASIIIIENTMFSTNMPNGTSRNQD